MPLRRLLGISLNDSLLLGPIMYPLLTSLLVNNICMSSDISKMFREVGLHSSDCDFLWFLKKDSITNQMQDWRNSRVTFGIICSLFLATQVLRQVALDYQAEFPTAADIINSTFYVDDCLTGASTVEEAVHIQEDLNALLSKHP